MTYGQVILAAAVSNFLGLSSSIFIMVVYDRVVPNQAIESLIALTIGVLIALGFDFLIKSLRANFIDKAGKRADSECLKLFLISMSMNLATKNEKSGALASTVREISRVCVIFLLLHTACCNCRSTFYISYLLYIIYLISWSYCYCSSSVCSYSFNNWNFSPTIFSKAFFGGYADRYV